MQTIEVKRTKEVVKLAFLAIWIICLAVTSGCAHSYSPSKGYNQFIYGESDEHALPTCIWNNDYSDRCAINVVRYISNNP